MGKKENAIEVPICEYAEGRGFEVRKVQWVGRRGAPDRFFMGFGVNFFIEFKAPDGVLAPWQVREIGRMHDSGVRVYVIDSIQEGKYLIDRELLQSIDYTSGTLPFKDKD